ncbi:MAG: hypothetical protein U0359_36660, partial [Byssovorax sp.]
TGSSAACPGDSLTAAGTVCRGSAGPCDVAEACTGSSAACPGDGFVAAGTVCRAAASGCDIAETCTGSSAACPGNSFVAAGTACEDCNGCTIADVCNGSGTCSGTHLPDGSGSHLTTCSTGLAGACATGATVCNGTVGPETCQQTVFPSGEVCDGVDNNCDGAVDNMCGNGACDCGENCLTCPGDCGSCCPFVYSGSNEGFAYETTVGGASLAPVASNQDSMMRFAPMWARLDHASVKGGAASAKILIGQEEIAYVDEAHLTVVDHPVGYEVISSSSIYWPGLGSHDPQELYALRTDALKAPVAATWMGKKDLASALGSLDELAVDADATVDNYYDLDFGAVTDARHARLVIDGWKYQQKRPLAAGTAERGPRLEVEGTDGAFHTVLELGYPRGDRKAVSFDLSGIKWPAGQYKMRLWTGTGEGGTAMWYLDRVRLTEEASAPVRTTELKPTSAMLSFAGAPQLLAASPDRPMFSLPNGLGQLGLLGDKEYTYGLFTRYGDVKTLLGGVDDNLVVMRKGDAIDLAFDHVPAVKAGRAQTLFLRTELLFKPTVCVDCDSPTEISNQVLPLPFHGMSRYPYTGDERFPSDAAHEAVLRAYNTREYKRGDTRWGN